MKASNLELAVLTAVGISILVATQRYYWSPMVFFFLYTYALLTPPMLFIEGIRTRFERIWVYVTLSLLLSGVAAGSLVQSLINGLECPEGRMVSGRCWHDGASTWINIVSAAGVLYCLPVYFTFVRLPRAEIAVPPGTLLDTVATSKICRAAAKAYCAYIALVSCTVAAAAAAVWLDLVAAETLEKYLSILGAVSLVYHYPRFVWPELNTRHSSRLFYLAALPAALAATGALHATGIVELESINFVADGIELVLFFIPSNFLNPHLKPLMIIYGSHKLF